MHSANCIQNLLHLPPVYISPCELYTDIDISGIKNSYWLRQYPPALKILRGEVKMVDGAGFIQNSPFASNVVRCFVLQFRDGVNTCMVRGFGRRTWKPFNVFINSGWQICDPQLIGAHTWVKRGSRPLPSALALFTLQLPGVWVLFGLAACAEKLFFLENLFPQKNCIHISRYLGLLRQLPHFV